MGVAVCHNPDGGTFRNVFAIICKRSGKPEGMTKKGTALCRPSDNVFASLANRPASFTREVGQTIHPGRGGT